MIHSHKHTHEYTHEHTHEHGPECDCGCHANQAEQVIENALIFSEKGIVNLSQPLPAQEVLSSVAEKIAEIAQSLSVDGAILGHVKGLFESVAGIATISITNIDAVHITTREGWVGNVTIDSYTLTANVLSLAHTDAPSDTWASLLFSNG